MKFSLYFILSLVLLIHVGCEEEAEECLNSDGTIDSAICVEEFGNIYLQSYFDTLKIMTQDFDDDATSIEVQAAHNFAISITDTLCCRSQINLNLSAIVEQNQFDSTISQAERDDFIALNNWLGLVSPNAYPGEVTTTIQTCQ